MSTFEDYVHEVIGSLRASNARKMRIREELLAHLHQAKNGCDTTGDDGEASDEAVLARFGDAADLRRRMQDSVPRMEQVFYQRLLDRRDGERDTRYAARCTAWALLLLAGFVLPLLAHCFVLRGWHALAGGLKVAIPMFLLVSCILYVAFIIEMRYQRLIKDGRWAASLALALLFSGIIGGMAFGLVAYLSTIVPGLQPYLPMAAALALTGTLGLTAVMTVSARLLLRDCPWIELGRDI